MTPSLVGGDESTLRYFSLYMIGVILGSLIRLVAYVFPSHIVRTLEKTLLGDQR